MRLRFSSPDPAMSSASLPHAVADEIERLTQEKHDLGITQKSIEQQLLDNQTGRCERGHEWSMRAKAALGRISKRNAAIKQRLFLLDPSGQLRGRGVQWWAVLTQNITQAAALDLAYRIGVDHGRKDLHG